MGHLQVLTVNTTKLSEDKAVGGIINAGICHSVTDIFRRHTPAQELNLLDSSAFWHRFSKIGLAAACLNAGPPFA